MNRTVAGWLAGIIGLAALTGGVVWYLRKRKKRGSKVGPTPSKPPRKPSDSDKPERADGDDKPPPPRYGFNYVDRDNLDAELAAEIDAMFGDDWPSPPEAVDQLETDHAIVFAVKSKPTGSYTRSKQEVVSARVLDVNDVYVRARIFGSLQYTKHHGTVAGHGLTAGTLVDVPREHVLVAAQKGDLTGYGSEGDRAAEFKSSHQTKQKYKVKPNTPYDLRLAYRTPHLEWYLTVNDVTMVQIGEQGLLEQIKFTEDSLRGDVSVRAIDNDPEEGAIFVGRWDFVIED